VPLRLYCCTAESELAKERRKVGTRERRGRPGQASLVRLLASRSLTPRLLAATSAPASAQSYFQQVASLPSPVARPQSTLRAARSSQPPMFAARPRAGFLLIGLLAWKQGKQREGSRAAEVNGNAVPPCSTSDSAVSLDFGALELGENLGGGKTGCIERRRASERYCTTLKQPRNNPKQHYPSDPLEEADVHLSPSPLAERVDLPAGLEKVLDPVDDVEGVCDPLRRRMRRVDELLPGKAKGTGSAFGARLKERVRTHTAGACSSSTSV
jgi:hypothetical protein